MFILVLNESNITPDGQNSELVYKFPNSVQFKDKYIAVSSIAMFYSWFNIISTSSNNILTYTWTALGITTSYNIVIPDGLYNIAEINNLIQFACIANNTYWINGGYNYYPFELLVNAPRYAVQLNTYLIPSTIPTGATIPPGFPGWPTIPQNSQIGFPANFNKIVGYSPNFISNANLNNAYLPPNNPSKNDNFVSKSGGGTISYLSNFAPQVQPNNNVLFSISNINNPYSQPSSIIYSLSPTVNVGQQIVEVPPNFIWNKLIDGTYNELRLQLLGTDKRRLKINDPNMTILLCIRDKIDIANL